MTKGRRALLGDLFLSAAYSLPQKDFAAFYFIYTKYEYW